MHVTHVMYMCCMYRSLSHVYVLNDVVYACVAMCVYVSGCMHVCMYICMCMHEVRINPTSDAGSSKMEPPRTPFEELRVPRATAIRGGLTVSQEAAIKGAWEQAGSKALEVMSKDDSQVDPSIRQRSKELVVQGLNMKHRRLAGQSASEDEASQDQGPFAAGGHKVSAALEAAAALVKQHPLLALSDAPATPADRRAGRAACVRKLGYEEAEKSALKRLKSEQALRQLQERHARELAEAQAKLLDDEMEETMSAEEQLRLLQEEDEKQRLAEQREARLREEQRLAEEREAQRCEEQRLAEEREAKLREKQRLAEEREAKRREEQRLAKEREAKLLEEQRLAKEREEAKYRELERLAKEREEAKYRELERLAKEREAELQQEQRLAEEREARLLQEQRLAKEREAYQQRRGASVQSTTSAASGGSTESLAGLKRKLSVLSQASQESEMTAASEAVVTTLRPEEQRQIHKLASESMTRASSNIITQGIARGASQDEMQSQLMKYYDEIVTELTQEVLEENAKARLTAASQQKPAAGAPTEDG